MKNPVLSLREAQTQFAAAVLDGSDPAYAIYRDNVFTCLGRALAEAHPVVERLVGERFFRHAASQYIAQHPSRSGDLNEFGEHFSGFLRDFPPTRELPYLPDVARLEWLCRRALLAADPAPLDRARLALLPAERYAELRLEIHPSVSLLASDWPVHRIWQVNQPGWTGDAFVDLRLGGVKLAVKRAGHRIELLPLAPGEWEFLCSFAGRLSFGEACDRALRAHPDFDAGPALRKLLEEELVA